MYTEPNPTPEQQTDDRVNAFFAGIDKTLAHVDRLLQDADVHVDLSAARTSVKNAGENVSRSVRKVKTAPVPAGQGIATVLIAFVKRFFASLFGTKKQTPPPSSQVRDEDLPFVEDDTKTAEPELQIPLSGDATVDSVVSFQLTQIAFVEDCATLLFRQHPKTAMQLEEICRVHRCILYALARRPEVLPKLQRFFGYYVPTLKKFCVAYADLSRQTNTAANADAEKTMRELETAFASLEQAFRKKVDELYGAVELDISSDLSVLDAMLRKDGLV